MRLLITMQIGSGFSLMGPVLGTLVVGRGSDKSLQSKDIEEETI